MRNRKETGKITNEKNENAKMNKISTIGRNRLECQRKEI